MSQLKMALLVLATLLIGSDLALAQNWTEYRLGNTTYLNGTDQSGGSWHGSSYQLGHMTYTDINGPNGQTQHCSSYKLGSTVYTDCH